VAKNEPLCTRKESPGCQKKRFFKSANTFWKEEQERGKSECIVAVQSNANLQALGTRQTQNYISKKFHEGLCENEDEVRMVRRQQDLKASW